MEKQNQSKQFQELKFNKQIQIKIKKTIVVIGKMGHGKSSFVKMLVRECDKKKIKVGSTAESITKECEIYQIDPELKLIDEPLYVIDTPGLDSESAAFLTVEKLENEIIQHNCQIIGLMYVLNIGEAREFKQNGESYIFTFLNNLKLKVKAKKNIFNFVLSRWDIHYKYQQTNNSLFQDFKKKFEKLQKAWDRKHLWISKPQQDIKVFQDQIRNSPKLKVIYQNQIPKLGKQLSRTIRNQLFVKYEEYIKDIELLNIQIEKNFESLLKYSKEPEQITKYYKINKGQTPLKEGLLSTTGGIISGVGTYLSVNYSTAVTLTTASTVAGQVNIIATGWKIGRTNVPLFRLVQTGIVSNEGLFIGKNTGKCFVAGGVIIAVGFLAYGIYKLTKKQQIKVQKISKISQIEDKQKRIFLSSKIKAIQLCLLQACIKLEQSQLIITQNQWIRPIFNRFWDCQNKQKQIKMKKILKDNKTCHQIDFLESGELKIKFKIHTPTTEAFEKYNEIQIQKIYGKIDQ